MFEFQTTCTHNESYVIITSRTKYHGVNIWCECIKMHEWNTHKMI